MSAAVGSAKRSADVLDQGTFNVLGEGSVDSFMSQSLHKRRMTQREDEDTSDSELDSDDDENDERDTDPAQAGVIEKLTLKNFMCHDFFELELGPQINFIIGRNGSGKSAILAGISVCLGAKATDTNRGSSIKDLIKDGMSTARITVVFLNKGSEAYKPMEYGNRIIVERKLSRVGANSYAIKSETGKVVSTKKSTLDEILHQFSITIDNPLAFLSQDKAREFLTTSTDQSKYEYFMDGAFVSTIINNFTRTNESITEVRKTLKKSKSQAEIWQKKYKDIKIIFDRYKESDYLRKQLQTIHGKALWYNVHIVEEKVKNYEKKLIQYQNEQVEISGYIRDLKQNDDEYRAKNQQLQEEASGIQAELALSKPNYEEVKLARELCESRIKESAVEINNRKAEAQSHKERIEAAKLEIVEEENRIDEINGQAKDELRSTLSQLQEQEEKLKLERKSAREELERLENSENPDLISAKNAFNQCKNTINVLERRRSQLSQKDKYAAWGNTMKNIVSQIDNYRGWHKKPIGPLGSMIDVKPEYIEWKPLLNTVLGKSLDSFLVCDEHDRRELSRIFQKNHARNNIIVRRFEEFDYERGKVVGQTTFLNMIEVADKNVLYTLVDTNTIEKFIIASERRDSDKLVNVPNVLGVFSLLSRKSGQRCSKSNGTLRIDPVFYSSELAKFSAGSASNTREKDEIESQIKEEYDNLETLKRKIKGLETSKKALLSTCRSKYTSSNESLELVVKEIRKVKHKIDANGDFVKIEFLKTEIDDLQSQVKKLENVITSLIQDIKTQNERFEVLKTEVKKAKADLQRIQARDNEVNDQLINLTTEISTNKTNIGHYETQADKRNTMIAECQAKIETGRSKLEEKMQIAENVCSRDRVKLTDDDTIESLEREYEEANRQMQQAERQVGRPLEDVQQELTQAKEQYESARSTVDHLEKSYRSLISMLHVRVNYLVSTIDKIIEEANRTFGNALELRGFKGTLGFNHEAKKLTLLVKSRNDKEFRTVDSLSGGEKSFAQIALLLSIWKLMNSRIRGLDEFDVFMDSVNRSISIKLLLSELRDYPKSQNIFITPQDIAVVGDLDSDDVKIHKMTDPRKDN